MKFSVKNPGENIYNLMRGIGYHFQKDDRKKEELVFFRRLGTGGYPRFHLHLQVDKASGNIIFNLHLDQKRPIYKGALAHSAEYKGETVKKEIERIKKYFTLLNNLLRKLKSKGFYLTG